MAASTIHRFKETYLNPNDMKAYDINVKAMNLISERVSKLQKEKGTLTEGTSRETLVTRMLADLHTLEGSLTGVYGSMNIEYTINSKIRKIADNEMQKARKQNLEMLRSSIIEEE